MLYNQANFTLFENFLVLEISKGKNSLLKNRTCYIFKLNFTLFEISKGKSNLLKNRTCMDRTGPGLKVLLVNF